MGVDRAGDRALSGDVVAEVMGLDPERVVGDLDVYLYAGSQYWIERL